MSLHSIDFSNTTGLDALAQSIAAMLKCDASLIGVVQDGSVFPVGYSGGGNSLPSRSFMARDTICGRTVLADHPLRISDVSADAVLSGLPMVEAMRIGAYLGVPMALEGVGVVGTICALSTSPRTWLDREVAYMAAIAELAVSKIERHLLRQERCALSAALAETDNILTMLSHSAGKAVTVHNAAGDLVFVNAAMRTALRLGHDDLVALAGLTSQLSLQRVCGELRSVVLPGPPRIALEMRIAAAGNGLTLIEWFPAA